MKSILLALAMLTGFSCYAQTYQLATYGTEDANCAKAKSIATWYLNQFETHNEQVVVICSDKEFQAFAKRVGSPSNNAFSIQIKKDKPFFIYIRAGALLGDVRSNYGFTPQHILAHEFGHIESNSAFCEIAERNAKRLMNGLKLYQEQK